MHSPCHPAAAQREGRRESNTSPSQDDTDKVLLTAQLKLQLYRIYTNVSRQREWFKLHETNARALVEEVEALRVRFFPREKSFVDTLNADDSNAESAAAYSFGMKRKTLAALPDASPPVQHDDGSGATDGLGDIFVPGAIRRIVPAYLLQLTPKWIHERLGAAGREAVSRAEAGEALVALLLPLLRALGGLAEMTRWHADASASAATGCADGRVTFASLCTVARHLFYLLHEALSCISSSWTTTTATRTRTTTQVEVLLPPHQLSSEEQVEARQILIPLLDARECGYQMHLHSLLFANEMDAKAHHHNSKTVAAVPQSVVSEAFGFLAIHYLGMAPLAWQET